MLTGVTRGEKRPPRIVIYGPAKIGKTTFGSEFPKAIFVTTEDGAEGLEVDRFPQATDWQSLIKSLEAVAAELHEYQTVVLDTLNGAAELASQDVCTRLFGGDWGPKGFSAFGHGQSAVSEEMRRLLPVLDKCRDRGMTVVLLAHTGVQSVRNPVEGDFQRYAPEMDRRVWGRFAKWADMIGRADYDFVVIRGNDNKTTVRGSSSRVLRFAGSAVEDVGCRAGFEMPETIEFSYQAFSEALGKDTETLDEVKRMWHLLDVATQKKTLTWLGSDLEHASLSKLKEVLNRLRIVEAKQQKIEEDSNAA